LSVGRKTRSIPLPLKRALIARDGGCRFPGCDRTRYTAGHHIEHWADGGETKLSNLLTLCSFHHRLIHEGGFGLVMTDDGVPVFTRPDGRRIPERGESFSGNSSVAALEAQNRAHGLEIDANTARCRWIGESCDYNQAIEWMQFAEQRAINSPNTARLNARRSAAVSSTRETTACSFHLGHKALRSDDGR
jgi:HNH endonuclease